MRLIVARCQVDYSGRLSAHLPAAVRLIMIKQDGSVSVHADDRAYKPLNWMSAPCTISERVPTAQEQYQYGLDELLVTQIWEVKGKDIDVLKIAIYEILHDSTHDLGCDPGLQKDGVEAHLQKLLAENPSVFGEGWTLVKREYMTAIGPVDLMYRNAGGEYVAVEVKRRGEIDGVEQLTRYLELLNRDHLLGDKVHGVFAAQLIKPQAKVLAQDRGITCVTIDYDALRGMDDKEDRLF